MKISVINIFPVGKLPEAPCFGTSLVITTIPYHASSFYPMKLHRIPSFKVTSLIFYGVSFCDGIACVKSDEKSII